MLPVPSVVSLTSVFPVTFSAAIAVMFLAVIISTGPGVLAVICPARIAVLYLAVIDLAILRPSPISSDHIRTVTVQPSFAVAS